MKTHGAKVFVAHIVMTATLLNGCATRPTRPARRMITLNDNGGWCWFQDERAIVVGDKLIVASLANSLGTDGANRGGNVEVTTLDLADNAPPVTTVLHANLQDDDHDVPALLALPDKRILAVYAKHGNDKLIRHRTSLRPGDTVAWQPERHVTAGAGVTYSNLLHLPGNGTDKGRIYNFYRGENWNPNWIFSDDLGQTWHYGGRLIAFQGRPYVKYASNNRDTIHFVTTEHHPHNHPNSIYHAYLKNGRLHRSDGTAICNVRDAPITPKQMTRVFAGDRDRVAWTCDIHLDKHDHPFTAYTVQKHMDGARIQYRYAWWDGRTWNDHFLAHAGTALYEREAHYAGLIALDPADPTTVYISTDADPTTGRPLISRKDNKRHYEIFTGRTPDRGTTWKWTPITKDSDVDNIRPIVPIGNDNPTILLWLRGTYTSYTEYDLDVVGIIGTPSRR